MKQKKTIAQRVAPKLELTPIPPGPLPDITLSELKTLSDINDKIRRGIYPDPSQMKLLFGNDGMSND